MESPPMQPCLSDATLMVARVMLRNRYEPIMGLGLVEFTENHGRFRLGYEPTHADKRRVALERRERSLAHLQRRGIQVERVPICHISESFVSVGWMREDQVAVIDKETPQDQPNWVQPCPPDFELGN